MRRVFEEPAVVASHTSIDARYRNLHSLKEQLEPLVDEQKATGMLTEVYRDVVG